MELLSQIGQVKRAVELDPEYFSTWERDYILNLFDEFAMGDAYMSDNQRNKFNEIYQKMLRR